MPTSLKQPALKPQDLAVLLKYACSEPLTYAQLSAQLRLAASQIHSSTGRLLEARLLAQSPEGIEVIKPALTDFVLYGAKYCFPAATGGATRGIVTSYAAPPLNALITHGEDLPPVWPHSSGENRGIALSPLYPAAPVAAQVDPQFYEFLALFDAIRTGAARERELAGKLLVERL